jgi:hypothetical protein
MSKMNIKLKARKDNYAVIAKNAATKQSRTIRITGKSDKHFQLSVINFQLILDCFTMLPMTALKLPMTACKLLSSLRPFSFRVFVLSFLLLT